MQFNSDSDEQDLVSLIGDMTGINTTAEIKQITRAANEANRRIWTWIFDAYGGWVYDDSNQSDLPTATAALVADQSKYTLPSEALTIRGVEVKDQDDNWRKMEAVSEEYIRQFYSEQEFQETSGDPRFYTPYSGLFKLHPAPSYAQNSSLRISFDRGAVAFKSTDIQKTPGFVSQFHEAVAVGASYYIATNKMLGQVDRLRERWGEMPEGVADRGYKLAIKEFYSQRFVEKGAPIINQGRNRLVRQMT